MNGRPINVTAGVKFDDPRMLALSLAAIWPEPEFEEIKAEICRQIADRAAVMGYSDFAASVEAILKNHSVPEGKWADALCRFEEHKAQTRTSERAYRPEGLENFKAVFWPDPSAPAPHGRPIYGEMPFSKRIPLLTKTTRIGSAGSCFAAEIRKYLTSHGYNYVLTEPNEGASANWGAQFNALAFQQTVEWIFGVRQRPLLVWESEDTGCRQYWDPFREGVYYSALDDVVSEWERHRRSARDALQKMDVFILTLGLIEVWRLNSSDAVIARYPRAMSPHLIRGEILTVDQNVSALEQALALLRAHNPTIRMIVTVSPIPLYATFQGTEKHVIVATQQAKSVLRVAVDQFAVRNPEAVTYFPAFETVMWCTKDPWQSDMRHVSQEAVDNVMRLFEKVFIKSE
jgi:hypothetical protein